MHVGLRQSGEAEGHPGFKSFRRGAEVRAKRPPRADDLLAMLMCCGAFASRMFLFCDLSCHLFTLACQAYAALALLRCCISCVCERVGLSGRWVCGLVSSPAVVPVRCLRAVKKVESKSSRVTAAAVWQDLRRMEGTAAKPKPWTVFVLPDIP